MLALFYLYPYIFAALFVLAVVAFGWLIVWTVETSPVAGFFQSRSGLVASYASVPAILFSLVMAFTVQDNWGRNTRAEAAVAREADAIRVIGTITHALGDNGTELNHLTVDYVASATGDDWLSAPRSDAADGLLRQMIQETLFGRVAQAGQQVQRAILDAVSDIRTSHRERLAAGDTHGATLKWGAALFLGCLTQVAVAFVHLGKPRPSHLAVTPVLDRAGFRCLDHIGQARCLCRPGRNFARTDRCGLPIIELTRAASDAPRRRTSAEAVA